MTRHLLLGFVLGAIFGASAATVAWAAWGRGPRVEWPAGRCVEGVALAAPLGWLWTLIETKETE